MLFFGVVLDGKQSFLFSQCGSDCHFCIQNFCVHQLFGWYRGVRNLYGILFSKVVHIKTVDTIKGLFQVRVNSFDISRANSALFRWSISFYGSHIYPLMTYISKLPCFVINLDVGPDAVYQVLGFVVVSSKNSFPLNSALCNKTMK